MPHVPEALYVAHLRGPAAASFPFFLPSFPPSLCTAMLDDSAPPSLSGGTI